MSNNDADSGSPYTLVPVFATVLCGRYGAVCVLSLADEGQRSLAGSGRAAEPTPQIQMSLVSLNPHSPACLAGDDSRGHLPSLSIFNL